MEKQVYYDLFHDFETHLFTFWTVRALIFDFLARTSHVYIVSFLRSLSLFFLFLISDSYQNTCCYAICCSLTSFKILFLFWKVSILFIFIFITAAEWWICKHRLLQSRVPWLCSNRHPDCDGGNRQSLFRVWWWTTFNELLYLEGSKIFRFNYIIKYF